MPRRRMSDDAPPAAARCTNQLCCCPPIARVWVETRTSATFVENKIDMKRELKVRADANASIQPPGGPGVNADGSGGSQLDEGTFKDQGKIYRVDEYTAHWEADACGPVQVDLTLAGAVQYAAQWLPSRGSVTVSRTYLLEPPTYAMPGPAEITATLSVTDCTKQSATCSNVAPRP